MQWCRRSTNQPMKINFAEHRSLITFIGACVAVAIGATVLLYIYINRELLPPAPVERPPTDEPIATIPAPVTDTKVLGQSIELRDITVSTFGNGETHVLLVGGIHGGYEWNTVALAEQMIAHLTAVPSLVPENLTVSIIPALNPDGLALVTNGSTQNITPALVTRWSSNGLGRFNANDVDLNRNFACKWQPQATWRGASIAAGTHAFSEPEARALRDYVLQTRPTAVVFWHSVAGAVYASECEAGVLPATLVLMNAYAEAADYAAVPVFDAYPVTGDAEGWLASIGIPAITVELETRDTAEWERNLAGTEALLAVVASQSVTTTPQQ